jgi:hypothetical protein
MQAPLIRLVPGPATSEVFTFASDLGERALIRR